MNAGSELHERVAAVDAGVLVPPRRPGGSPVGPVTVRAVLALGDGLALGVFADGEACLVAPLVVRGSEPVRRAGPGDGAFERVLGALARGESAAGFSFEPIGSVPDARGERAIEADQSNESVVVGERAVVKLYPRTSPGPQPGQDIPVHLASVGFTSIPAPFGSVSWTGEPGPAVMVATASAFLPGASDGWDWYLELLLAWLRGEIDDERAFEPAPVLGRLAGELHAALATPSRVFPTPVRTTGVETLGAWKRRAERSLDEALELTDGEPGRALTARAERVRSAFEVFDQVEAAATTRIHGDLHVGQFLRWPGGVAIADFDGNPLAPAGERMALDSPVRDVAALLRSVDHLGRIAQRREAGPVEAIEAWIARSRSDLVEAYRGSLGAWKQRSLYDPRLVFPMEVAQECHEFAYAARYLPSWVSVPDLAIRSLFP